MQQLEAILRGSLGFNIVLWTLMTLFLLVWDTLMSGRPFWRHMVQLCCYCCNRWVMRHVSPLRCSENYWVHVIVSLKQDASHLRMLSRFWRVNPSHAVTKLSPSILSEQTTSSRTEWIFLRLVQVGVGTSRHQGNFYAIRKKSVSVNKQDHHSHYLLIPYQHMISKLRKWLRAGKAKTPWVKIESNIWEVTSRVRCWCCGLISCHVIFSLKTPLYKPLTGSHSSWMFSMNAELSPWHGITLQIPDNYWYYIFM